jgi:hypothetical protein
MRDNVISNVITDRRVLGALCRRLMKIINSKGEIYPSPNFYYIEFLNVDDLTPSIFEEIKYKNNIYRLKFLDGCFSPYFSRLT